MPASTATPTTSRQPSRRVQLGAGEAGDQPRRREARRSACRPPARATTPTTTGSLSRSPSAGDHDAGRHQREERHRDGSTETGESRCSSRSAGLSLLAGVAAYPGRAGRARRRRWSRGCRSRGPATRPARPAARRPAASSTRRRWSSAQAASTTTAPSSEPGRCSDSVKKTAMITITIRSSTTASVSRNARRAVGRLDPTTASTASANAMSVAAGIAQPSGLAAGCSVDGEVDQRPVRRPRTPPPPPAPRRRPAAAASRPRARA